MGETFGDDDDLAEGFWGADPRFFSSVMIY